MLRPFREFIGAKGLKDKMVYQALKALDDSVHKTPAITQVLIPADATASEIWEKPISLASTEGKVSSIVITPIADAGQATDYMTLSVVNKGSDGAGTTVVATNAFSGGTGEVLEANKPFFMTVDSAKSEVISPNSLFLKKEIAGAGEEFPGALVTVIYAPV